MNRDTPAMREEIVKEASTWFVELNETPQDPGMREAFDSWLRRSPEHVRAFLHVSEHWEHMTPRADAPVESIDELLAYARSESNVVSLASTREPAATLPSGASLPASRAFRHRKLLMLAAASVMLATAGIVLWLQFFSGVYGTSVGEQRSVVLADGSRVDLNSRSRIRVRYRERERHIDLIDGQALFEVTRNPARPFVVQSGATSVRAVGTRFDVYRKDGATVVTVVEGRVAVTSDSKRAAPVEVLSSAARGEPANRHQLAQVLVSAGQQLTVGVPSAARAAPMALDSAGVEAATAWTQHRLVFKGAPLSDVVSEFNRYSKRQIVIADASIGTTQISGAFSSSDPSDLLKFLREFGSCEVRETADQIVISRK